MRALHALPLLLLAACGDDGAQQPVDAPLTLDAAIDAGLPIGCDYAERRDLTNDDVSSGSGSPEPTGLMFTTKTVICGTLEATHFDGDITVDIDAFTFSLAADADVLVRLHGTGLATPELVGVDVYGGASLNQLVGSNSVIGSHAVTAIRLTAGTYKLSAFALHSAALASAMPYRLEVVADAPATRCPELTTGGYAEMADGAASTGNDMIRLVSGTPPAQTASPGDSPEPTAFSIAGGTNHRITGSAADVAVADVYEDVDTYAFATSATTNELGVRLTWPGATTNLDYLLFEASSAEPVIRQITTATQGPELRTFAVKTGTSYWLLVGAKAGTGGLPAAYTATLCGATFTP
ncbi:MAG: hypothetical protein H0T42_17135 [Deltaproteobacteria bacterium]|nr:hypothetical protein [Deltaproteobacteria bacterium]